MLMACLGEDYCYGRGVMYRCWFPTAQSHSADWLIYCVVLITFGLFLVVLFAPPLDVLLRNAKKLSVCSSFS